MKILVTGIAGFIGAHLAKLLASQGHRVVGIDNINDYYDQNLKYIRLNELCGIETKFGFCDFVEYYNNDKSITFIKMDLTDRYHIEELFNEHEFDKVINLAAQAGVRYSIDHPYEYINSNIVGFMNILEACRGHKIKHFIYASSSSVYGLNDNEPFIENDKTDRPVSLYAASKKSNELMAHAYAKLYNIHATGLRFFTVYGPYGRPDMSPTLFANSIKDNKSIKVFNNGNMYRDFTYIDDIVNSILSIVNSDQPINEDGLYYGVYNIGCGHPEPLLYFIQAIEESYGKTVEKEYLPMQSGDVYKTYASTEKLEKDFGYKPSIGIDTGIPKFIEWYKQYYNKQSW